jgi:CRISPR system Cascade subunit CasE
VGDEKLVGWLERKAATGGFKVLATDVRDEGPDSVVQGIHPAGKVKFKSVVFSGRLVVMDSNVFRSALENGLGPGKAYGFGLLSIAPSAGR